MFRFYAVFTTGLNGLHGSAVCSFRLDDVHTAFDGKFKVGLHMGLILDYNAENDAHAEYTIAI